MDSVAVIVRETGTNCAVGNLRGLRRRQAVELNRSIRSRLRRFKATVGFPVILAALFASSWIGCTPSDPPQPPPAATGSGSEEAAETREPEPPGSLTFTRDIAPIVFRNCSPCHRPGGAGPFDLLSYDDVKTRGRLMVAVTQSRYMPPWQPEPGYGEFIGERRLGDAQIEMLQKWVSQGAAEGDPADLPGVPEWPAGWLLGPPDLIVTMPRPYMLAAEAGSAGKDVFRTFVLPVPLESMRYVRALELRPGNPKVVHHIVGGVDPTPRPAGPDARFRRDEVHSDGSPARGPYPGLDAWKGPHGVRRGFGVGNTGGDRPGAGTAHATLRPAGTGSAQRRPLFQRRGAHQDPLHPDSGLRSHRYSGGQQGPPGRRQLCAAGGRAGDESLSACPFPGQGDGGLCAPSRRQPALAPLHQGLGLQLAGRLSLRRARLPSARHRTDHALQLRQLGRQCSQSSQSTPASGLRPQFLR